MAARDGPNEVLRFLFALLGWFVLIEKKTTSVGLHFSSDRKYGGRPRQSQLEFIYEYFIFFSTSSSRTRVISGIIERQLMIWLMDNEETAPYDLIKMRKSFLKIFPHFSLTPFTFSPGVKNACINVAQRSLGTSFGMPWLLKDRKMTYIARRAESYSCWKTTVADQLSDLPLLW